MPLLNLPSICWRRDKPLPKCAIVAWPNDVFRFSKKRWTVVVVVVVNSGDAPEICKLKQKTICMPFAFATNSWLREWPPSQAVTWQSECQPVPRRMVPPAIARLLACHLCCYPLPTLSLNASLIESTVLLLLLLLRRWGALIVSLNWKSLEVTVAPLSS